MSKLLLRCINKIPWDSNGKDHNITIGKLYLGSLDSAGFTYKIIDDYGNYAFKYMHKFKVIDSTAAKLLYGVDNESDTN